LSFEQMRGDLLRLRFDLVERLHDRRAADRDRTRAIRTHAERNPAGVAVDDLDAFQRNAEPVGDDLREGRFVPLAMTV
jgi:hypothetical protein